MNTQTQLSELHNLDSFKQRAIWAHNWISFNPDRRGEQIIQAYGEQLKEDIEKLQTNQISEDIIQGYAERYKLLFSSWISAKSNCASSVITGGSGFNVRRAEKANRSEERHYTLWQEWRERAIKAIVRKSKPEKTYQSELERYRSELASMQRCHELMKQGNIMIKKAKKEGKDITEYLASTFNIKPHMIEWTMKFGFGLTNNNANMKRVEQRIKELEAKEKAKEVTGGEATIWQVFGATAICNYEADRVQIKTDIKPNPEIITALKKNAFKWSPSNQVWQRQLTLNAMSATRQLKNIFAPTELNNAF